MFGKLKRVYYFVVGAVLACTLIFMLIISIDYSNEPKKVLGENTQNIKVASNMINKIPYKEEGISDPEINAKAYFLMEANSFYPMSGKNEKEILSVASTTKVATALVVLEEYADRLQDVVTITFPMINVIETRIHLLTGEKITVESLLEGLLINSGNDAAYALATHFGGLENFVEEMNNKMEKLGLQNTKFYDPAGLDDRGHSNARELAILGAYALKNQKIAEIVKIPEKTIYSIDGRFKHDLINSNRLVKPNENLYLPYAIGVKTGFTYEAGHVLISAGEKNGNRLIAVILNTYKDTKPASAEECRKLLEWGFNHWD